MRRGNLQVIHQRDDVRGHLFDLVDVLLGYRATASSWIVDNQIERFRQRHLRRFPNFAGISGGGHENQRLSSTMRFIVKIDSGWQFNIRHLYLLGLVNRKMPAVIYISRTAYHRRQTAVEAEPAAQQ